MSYQRGDKVTVIKDKSFFEGMTGNILKVDLGRAWGYLKEERKDTNWYLVELEGDKDGVWFREDELRLVLHSKTAGQQGTRV